MSGVHDRVKARRAMRIPGWWGACLHIVFAAPLSTAGCSARSPRSEEASQTSRCPEGRRCAGGEACVSGECVPVRGLAAGFAFTCAVVPPSEVRCFGSNTEGQLGLGRASARERPTKVPGLSHVVELSAGDFHACARTDAGEVFCWGKGSRGEIGDGSNVERATRTRVASISDAVALAAGAEHTCALSRGGAVFCWGANDGGQLGDGTKSHRSAPVRVALPARAAGIAAASWTSCAWFQTGEVYCWGDLHEPGPDNTGRFERVASPRRVRTISGVAQVAVGYAHICARTSAGSVVCWGVSHLGNATPQGSSAPDFVIPVPGLGRVVDLVASAEHTCARSEEGRVLCFGKGLHAPSSGMDPEPPASVPLAVPGLSGVVELATGANHTCARMPDASIRCWGDNDDGQLGDGTREARREPTPLLPPGAPLSPYALDDRQIGAGDRCESDADCGFEDPCTNARCVAHPAPAPSMTCAASPAPARCECAMNRCAKRPSRPPKPPPETCQDWADCAVDEPAGRCMVAQSPRSNLRNYVSEGPLCRCDPDARQCIFEWVEPVACKRDADCWFSNELPHKAIRRPPQIRRPFQPCRGGEVPPVCSQGICSFGHPYPC